MIIGRYLYSAQIITFYMKYVKLSKKYLKDFEKFIQTLSKDFVFVKNLKSNKINKYFDKSYLHMLLVLDNQKIVGYHAYNSNLRGKGYLIGVGISKKYRNKKIASTLLKKSLNDLKNKGIKEVKVRTWENNLVSLNMLRKFGFKKYKTIKNDRIDGTSTIWLRLFF